MGLAFLPWERLPAYILGPLLIAIGVGIWMAQDVHTIGAWIEEGLLVAAGVGLIVWRRVSGEEPLWSEEQKAASRKNSEEHRRNTP